MDTRTKGIFWYLLIAFVPAWLMWEGAILLGLNPSNPITFQFVALPGAFCPAVASIVVRKWITREGFADAGLRLNLRRGWRFYLVGWLLPIPVIAIIIGLSVAFGVASPDFSFHSAFDRFSQMMPGTQVPSVPAGFAIGLPFLLLAQSLVFSPLLWGEEFGWRGYLQLRLFPSRPLAAAVATGIIWGVWHLPINIQGYNFPGHPVIGMFVFTVSTIVLSIVFGWLRRRTGSVWASSLAHAATNSVGGGMLTLLFAGADPLFVGYLGLLALIPLGALAIWIAASGQLKARPS
jgi:membrane protease YdiL (CAAX protease family)